MRIISLRCNECGAPIRIKETVRFLTCEHCRASLAVERTGGVYHTEKIDSIHQNTETIVDSLEVIEIQNDIANLEREWAADPRNEKPDSNGIAMMIIGFIVVVFGAIGTMNEAPQQMSRPSNKSQKDPAILLVVGLVIMGTGIWNYVASERFNGVRSDYEWRRQSLETKLEAARKERDGK